MHHDEEITEVARVREEHIINDQPVADEIVRLAREDQEVDTAVVSFFDVDYVRKNEDVNTHSERARTRIDRRISQSHSRFIRK